MKVGVNSRIFIDGKGGISRYVEYLYRELLNIDEKNDYVFFQTGGEKKIGTTRIIEVSDSGQIGTFLFDNFLVNNLVEKAKIDIFHGPSSILPVLKKKDVKYIVTVHDLAFLKIPHICNLLYKSYYKLALGQSLKNADVIIADSKSTKNDIMEFYRIQDSKIKVVSLGVDDAFWNTDHKERIVKERYFLSVATHSKRKNILGVLKAFARSKYLSDFKYVIIGTIFNEKLRKELNKTIKKLGLAERVFMLGYVKKKSIISLYQNAEFFVYPCLYDGFSFPVLEAMASECPVIASDNSAFIELVPNREWLVDPYNIKDIKDKMEKMAGLSNKERNELIKENYAFAKHFTWRHTALKMMNIFRSLS